MKTPHRFHLNITVNKLIKYDLKVSIKHDETGTNSANKYHKWKINY